ncbi:hypothetical protein GQ44DRAFT_742552 [Phaeosphaeriaceae sp. PMI808]|nr:hypothetical protein GQ44DRAFT_742552 [Phaeosphaeriaceae sp. PMI808]
MADTLVAPITETKSKQTLASGLVDTSAAAALLVDSLLDLPNDPLDVEGINLCRHGSISILQLFILPTNQVYLIAVHTVEKAAFSTCGASGKSPKTVLESESIIKAFFDVRNDSDALYSHFYIALAGICDIQLMELATRSHSKKFLAGLAKCIHYEVFNARPMSEEIKQYCVQDVRLLPRLWQTYFSKFSAGWRRKAEETAGERVRLSQMSTYNGRGPNRALGPWN